MIALIAVVLLATGIVMHAGISAARRWIGAPAQPFPTSEDMDVTGAIGKDEEEAPSGFGKGSSKVPVETRLLALVDIVSVGRRHTWGADVEGFYV